MFTIGIKYYNIKYYRTKISSVKLKMQIYHAISIIFVYTDLQG